MDTTATPLHGSIAIPWSRSTDTYKGKMPHSTTPKQRKKPSDMPIKIPRWLIPVITAVAMTLTAWLGTLTMTVSEVLQAQARAEHLADSHQELRMDVKQQGDEMARVRESLARIEFILERSSK